MIVIVDYDMGNVGSIKNMLKKIGESNLLISNDPKVIKKAEKLILPGVGAFDFGMENIKKYNLNEIIREHAIVNKKPLLGICLGMQLLGESSEEGKQEGLGLIPFKNVKFQFDKKSIYKVPHMGWNYVNTIKEDDPIVHDFKSEDRFYFVHSYYASEVNEENILMTSNYKDDFVSAVVKDNIYGVQFHPEKSHRFGMKLLRNFVREVK